MKNKKDNWRKQKDEIFHDDSDEDGEDVAGE